MEVIKTNEIVVTYVEKLMVSLVEEGGLIIDMDNSPRAMLALLSSRRGAKASTICINSSVCSFTSISITVAIEYDTHRRLVFG